MVVLRRIAFALSALASGAHASLNENLILLGPKWDAISAVSIETDSRADQPKKTWKTSFAESDHHFLYKVAVEPGHHVNVRAVHGKHVHGVQIAMKNCRQETLVEVHKIKFTDSEETLISVCTNVRHQCVLRSFVQMWKEGGYSTDQKTIEKAYRVAVKEHVGYELVFFFDHMQGDSVELEFVPKASGSSKKTSKKIQHGSGGTVFASWSVPKEPGTLKISGEGVTEEIVLDKVSMVHIQAGSAHLHTAISLLSMRSDAIWRAVVSEQKHNTTETHAYWNFESQTWKQDALDKLFDETKAKKVEVGEFESDGEERKTGWKFILIIVIMVLILVFGVYWFCFKSTQVSDVSGSQTEIPELAGAQMNEGEARLGAPLNEAEKHDGHSEGTHGICKKCSSRYDTSC